MQSFNIIKHYEKEKTDALDKYALCCEYCNELFAVIVSYVIMLLDITRLSNLPSTSAVAINSHHLSIMAKWIIFISITEHLAVFLSVVWS